MRCNSREWNTDSGRRIRRENHRLVLNGTRASARAICERTVIRHAYNPEEYRGLRIRFDL